MHTDARTLENNSLIEGDLCIVGAGAAGISMALQWIGTPYKVILLEGGGFEYEAAMQDMYKGRTTGQPYFTLESSRLHYFGGTTGHWAGYCSTFDSIDFEKRSWVPHSGWPITLADLEPYYPIAQQILELGYYSYDPAYWLRQDASLKPLEIDNSVVWNKIWQFSPPTRFGTKYRDAIVNAPNIHLYTYANVTGIRANESVSSVTELTVKNLAGRQHTVRAKKYVLACCAIQNARLLLAANTQSPKGLGNDNGLVGRYFMEHLEVPSAELLLPAARSLKFYELRFFHTKIRAELALTAQQQRQLQVLNGTASLTPKESKEPATTPAAPGTATPAPDEHLQGWKRSEAYYKEGKLPPPEYKPCKVYELFTRMEQSPNPSSRITLDAATDALGLPRAALHWQLTPLEKTSIRKLYETVGQQAGKAEIGRVRMLEWLHDAQDSAWPSSLGGGWHHMGTTRMHDDPKQGVADRNCRVHGINNLYIAGSSCFTTGGAANPTLTLVALTLRLSAHLRSLF
jgi:choline dehydrogenase-like flavoprotein